MLPRVVRPNTSVELVLSAQAVRRTFEPNLQNIKIWLPNGKTQQVRVATSVIRTGLITIEVDGVKQTFPLIKAVKGSAQARIRMGNLYPI